MFKYGGYTSRCKVTSAGKAVQSNDTGNQQRLSKQEPGLENAVAAVPGSKARCHPPGTQKPAGIGKFASALDDTKAQVIYSRRLCLAFKLERIFP